MKRLTDIDHINSGDVEVPQECDCGAETTGKWADRHSVGCASLQPSPMAREEIIQAIREGYDPEPNDWPRHRDWDDGAGEIADKILERFSYSKSDNPIRALDKCPKCGLEASRGLHLFCTRGTGECPVR